MSASDIPTEVLATAIHVAEEATRGWRADRTESVASVVTVIARAILAERERCAAIADFGVKWTPQPSKECAALVAESCSRIAASIRSGQ